MRTFKTNYKGITISVTITNKTTYFDADGISTIACKNKDAQEIYKDLKVYIDGQVVNNSKALGLVKVGQEYVKVAQFYSVIMKLCCVVWY